LEEPTVFIFRVEEDFTNNMEFHPRRS